MNNGNISLGFVIGAAVSASLVVYYVRKTWEVTKTKTNTYGHTLERYQQVNLPVCLICKKSIYSTNSTIQFPCCHIFHEFCVMLVGAVDACVICFCDNEPLQELTSHDHIQEPPSPKVIKSNQMNRCEASSSRQYVREENRRQLDIIYCIICNNLLGDVNSETTFSCNHAFHKRCMKSVFKQNENVICIICNEGPIKEIHHRQRVDLPNTPELCTICNNLVYDRAKIFSCGHIFHNKCMRFIFGAHCTWTCITCVEPVSSERQVRHIDGATDEDERDVCVICMDVLLTTRRRKLTCGHSFHNACIEKWSAKSKVCPFRCNAKN